MLPVFADNPWFASLPAGEAEALLAAGRPIKLSAGESLFVQGDAVPQHHEPAFFGVVRGLLKVQLLHPDGKEAVLAVIEPGNWFGEVAILEGKPRDFSAVALADVELLALDGAQFAALMTRAGFAAAIARLVASRLRMAYHVMGDTALQSMRERVARRLLMLAHGDITLLADGRTSLNTSQDLVATMLGISRPTLNKELHALADLGAVALRYGRIEIRDMQLLQDCAGLTRD